MKRTPIIPRGIRNNNPLNIRIGNVWLGEVNNPDDPDFEQFVSMAYGIRAACVLLRRYIRHYHRNTLTTIISAWAPSTENNTAAYVERVSSMSGIPVDKTIDYADVDVIVALLDAMIFVECGQHVKEDIIRRGYTMA